MRLAKLVGGKHGHSGLDILSGRPVKSKSSADRDNSTARNVDLGLNRKAGLCRNYRGRIPEPVFCWLRNGNVHLELTQNGVVELTAQTTRSLHVRPPRGLTGSETPCFKGYHGGPGTTCVMR